MRQRRVEPVGGPFRACVRAVSSKSVTHRALVAAALGRGVSEIRRPLWADDTRATAAGLRALGIGVREEARSWIVEGHGGHIPGGGRLLLGDSGTSLRLLLAVACLGERESWLDGSPRLRERPIAELVEALRNLGARVEAAGRSAGLPLRAGARPPAGGPVRVRGDLSSQFASALLLVGPHLRSGLDLVLEPPAVSLPYVDLTARVMERFGMRVARPEPLRFVVGPGDHAGRVYDVEGDYSMASYFLAAAAVVGGRVRVLDLPRDSAQPDARMGRILEAAGCRVRRAAGWIEASRGAPLRGVDVDLRDAPDIAPTVAVVALFAREASVLRGVAHLRLKESDRLELVAQNLRAMGRPAVAHADRLEIGPSNRDPSPALIRTGSDHRIAMAFAVAGLRVGVEVDDADCVAKSNPGFWDQLARLARCG